MRGSAPSARSPFNLANWSASSSRISTGHGAASIFTRSVTRCGRTNACARTTSYSVRGSKVVAADIRFVESREERNREKNIALLNRDFVQQLNGESGPRFVAQPALLH